MAKRDPRAAIESYRRQRRLTKSEIARKIGITPSEYSDLLSGRRRPTLDRAVDIEERIGVPAHWWAER